MGGGIPFIPGVYQPRNNIAELILRSGEQNAQNQYRNANTLGSLISGAGQAVGQGLEQQQQQQAQAKRDAAWVSAIHSGVLDDPKAGTEIAFKLFGKDGAGQLKAYQDARSLAQGSVKPEEALPKLGNVAKRLIALGDGAIADLWPSLLPLAKGANLQVPDRYTPDFRQHLEAFAAMGDKEKPAEPFTLSPGQARYGPDGKVLATGPAEPAKPETRSIDVQLADPGITPQRRQQLLQTKRDIEAAGRAPESSDEAPQLNPAALDMVATQFAQSGVLPPMGMGKVGARVRQAIINRAAELFPNTNLATSKAGFAANQASLTQMQKNTDAVTAFENTAKENGKILEEAIKKIPDASARFLNVPIRAAASQLGSEDQASFEAIRQAVQNEYSRIISQPNLSGQLSDSARKEGEAILSGDYTGGQLMSAYRTLVKEAGNRRQNYQAQIEAIKSRLGGGGGGGQIQVKDPTGKVHEFATQAQADEFKRLAGIK